MSFIIPKKPQILYAPMLGSLGGGSVRGFGRGVGGGIFYDFTNASFRHPSGYTVGGSNGRFGPTLAQVRNGLSGTGVSTWSNNTAFLSVSTYGAITWQVPHTGSFTLEALGAKGGHPSGRSGYGARAKGIYDLTAGEYLILLVGHKGSNNNGGAGGGGSFIIRSSTGQPLVVAGGGGGSGAGGGNSGNTSDANNYATGQSTTDGSDSSTYGSDPRGAGGFSGFAGNVVSTAGPYWGGAGAGWKNHEAPTAYNSAQGARGATHSVTPGWGGQGFSNNSPGGFGGGGGGGEWGAGGGGGYSGGGASNKHAPGGGGGSYTESSGIVRSITENWTTNDGQIDITAS